MTNTDTAGARSAQGNTLGFRRVRPGWGSAPPGAGGSPRRSPSAKAHGPSPRWCLDNGTGLRGQDRIDRCGSADALMRCVRRPDRGSTDARHSRRGAAHGTAPGHGRTT